MKRNVICIKWGDKFGADYVNRLYKMVERNLTLEHRFVALPINLRVLIKELKFAPCPS